MKKLEEYEDPKHRNRRKIERRRERLDEAAKAAGFESWSKAETAVRNGTAVIRRIEMKPVIYKYFDPENAYQHATLQWEGPGYYAGYTDSLNSMTIHQIAPKNYDGDERWPKAPEGYGTVSYCETPQKAAGYYADHEIQ